MGSLFRPICEWRRQTDRDSSSWSSKRYLKWPRTSRTTRRFNWAYWSRKVHRSSATSRCSTSEKRYQRWPCTRRRWKIQQWSSARARCSTSTKLYQWWHFCLIVRPIFKASRNSRLIIIWYWFWVQQAILNRRWRWGKDFSYFFWHN